MVNKTKLHISIGIIKDMIRLFDCNKATIAEEIGISRVEFTQILKSNRLENDRINESIIKWVTVFVKNNAYFSNTIKKIFK